MEEEEFAVLLEKGALSLIDSQVFKRETTMPHVQLLLKDSQVRLNNETFSIRLLNEQTERLFVTDSTIEALTIISSSVDSTIVMATLTLTLTLSPTGDFSTTTPSPHVVGWSLYVHKANFEREMTRRNCFSGSDAFIYAMVCMHSEQEYGDLDNIVGSDDTVPPSPLPVCWKPEADLRPDQHASVNWMRSLENEEKVVSVPIFLPLSGTRFAIVKQDLGARQDAIMVDLRAIPHEKLYYQYAYNGGVLADGMGTGKTATVIRLIASTCDQEAKSPTGMSVLTLIPVRATLVIVPGRLLEQWRFELEKFTRLNVMTSPERVDGALNCVFISDKTHYLAASISTVTAADVVLVSSDFLVSSFYVNLGTTVLDFSSLRTVFLRHTAGELTGTESLSFSRFCWKRIVRDEYHVPLSGTRRAQQALRDLRGNFYWAVTATPNPTVMIGVLHCVAARHFFPQVVIDRTVRRSAYVPDLMPVIHHKHLIDLSDTERETLMARRQDCLIHTISRCTHNDQPSIVAMTRQELQQSPLHKKRQLDSSEFFQKQLNEPASNCPICFQDHECDILTRCGHWFCVACSLTYINQGDGHVTCPLCKQVLGARDFVRVVETSTVSTVNSKFESIVALLNDVRKDNQRALIFIQWPGLLSRVQSALVARNFRVVAITKTSNAQSSVERFRAGRADVVLMFPETIISGLHFNNVEHVIFAHAFVGGKAAEYERCIRYCVNRASFVGQSNSVHVHWFITTGTDEQILHISRTSGVPATCPVVEKENDMNFLVDF